MSNSLDPDQAPCFVEPDLGPNCLQKLSTDNTSRLRVNSGGDNLRHSMDVAAGSATPSLISKESFSLRKIIQINVCQN